MSHYEYSNRFPSASILQFHNKIETINSMDEPLWADIDYSVDLDQDFDSYLAREWIDSFNVSCGDQVDSAKERAEDEAVPFLDADLANLDFVVDLEYLFTPCHLVPEVSPQPHSNSAAMPLILPATPVKPDLNAFTRRPEKRRFEECLSEFVGTQPMNMTKKGRKSFSAEGRKKTDQVRKAGACIRCKLLKTPVSLSKLPSR
jgi:hypothetical protein